MGTLELSNLIQLEINENLRNISIPKKGVVFGVDGDIEVNRVAFVFPRYYSNFDMTEFSARVNYVNANGEANYYEADDMSSDDGDTATFSWLMTSDVTSYIGEVRFSVLLYKRLDERYVKKFGTRPATGRVLEGLDVESYVTPEQQLTLIEKMEKKFDAYVEAKMLSVNHDIEDAKNGALDSIEEAKNDVDSFITSSKSEIDTLRSSSLDDIKNLTDTNKLNISTLTDEKLASLDKETVRQLKNIELAGVEETEKIRTAFSSAVSDIQTEGQKQADAVDSHGDSKIKEINDSTAISLANINSISEKQVEAIQLEGTKQTSSVSSEGNKQVSTVTSAGTTEVTKVKSASSTALSNIDSAKEYSISEITAKGTEQVKIIKDTSTSEISKVQAAGTSQVKSVSDEGKIQIDGVKSEGEKQVQSVSAKGTQSLQDIDTAKTAAVKSVNDQTKPIIDKVEQLKQNVNDKSDSVDETYEQMKKLHCIEVSEEAPTNERAGLWVNPESNEEINIPEIKDEEVSGIDTWSSQKINHEIDSVKENKIEKPAEAPTIGKIIRVKSVNEDGTFVCEWADSASDLDVRIDGKSIVRDGVAEIPKADTNTHNLGLIRVNAGNGFAVSADGTLNIIECTDDSLKKRYARIVSGNVIDYAVKAAMCDGKGAMWTADEQKASLERQGIYDWELLFDSTLEEDVIQYVHQFQNPFKVKKLLFIVDSPITDLATEKSIYVFWNKTKKYDYPMSIAWKSGAKGKASRWYTFIDIIEDYSIAHSYGMLINSSSWYMNAADNIKPNSESYASQMIKEKLLSTICLQSIQQDGGSIDKGTHILLYGIKG